MSTARIPADNAEYNTQEDTILNQVNKNGYNDLMLAQDYIVYFDIFE